MTLRGIRGSRFGVARIAIPVAAVLWSFGVTARAACLSGFVRDRSGRPVPGGDLDFFDFETGSKISTSGDGTDVFGFYSVCVHPGVYRVTFAPPPGTRLLGNEFSHVDLSAAGGREMDVVLDQGRVVTGAVRTADGVALGGVDVDVDRASGGRLFTPNDKSDATSGAYAIVIPDGTYRFRFTPPRGAPWQGLQLDAVAITGDQTLDVNLQPGALLYGRLRDEVGRPQGSVELDLRRREDGTRVFLVNKSADSNGDYAVAVPRGAFEVRFVPPRGSRAVAARIDNLTIDDDTRLDLVLVNGFLVTAVALDSAGAPLEDADVKAVQESSGLELFLPHDETGANGRTQLALPPDLYSFRLEPPDEKGLDEIELRGIPVTRDTLLAAWLPSRGWPHVRGRVVDQSGKAVVGAMVHVLAIPGGGARSLPILGTNASGAFDLALPRGVCELRVTPPRGTRLVAQRLLPATVTGDAVLGDIVLESGFLFEARVTNELGVPVLGASLRFAVPGGGAELDTAETDASGIAIVALSPALYDVTVTPPAGAALSSTTLTGIEVRADIAVEFVLQLNGNSTPPLTSFQSLAPNPFRRAIEIGVAVHTPALVSIDLYDAAGRRVRTLAHGEQTASNFTCAWDGSREDGGPAPAGVYFVVLRAPATTDTRKILLLR